MTQCHPELACLAAMHVEPMIVEMVMAAGAAASLDKNAE
jgi:hypothetical protein